MCKLKLNECYKANRMSQCFSICGTHSADDTKRSAVWGLISDMIINCHIKFSFIKLSSFVGISFSTMLQKHRILACRAVSRQRFAKHVPTATDTHATIKVLLETVFSTRFVQRGYKEDNWSKNSSKRNKHLVVSTRWGSTPKLTNWLTVNRNVTSIWLIEE
jgi:hypothetical protein